MSAVMMLLTGALWGIVPQRPDTAQAPDIAPLTLPAAIAEALAASPALQPARDAVEIAGIREQLEQSRFGVEFTPMLQLGTLQNGMRQQQAGLAAVRRLPSGTEISITGDWLRFGAGDQDQRDAGVSVTLSQSLFQAFGPVPRAGITAAKRATARASRAVAEARQHLVLRTAAAYFAIVRHELLTEAAAQAQLRARRLHASSEARARVGLATRLDVMRAELLASQTEASLAAARESLERTRDELNVLLGRPVDMPLAVSHRDVPDTVAPIPADLNALQASAVERRLDLQESREQIGDAERAQAVARWAALPDMRITASYTQRGLGDSRPSVFQEWLGGWRAGVSTTYGMQRAAASAAEATAAIGVRAAEREAFAREQAAVSEVRSAHRAVVRTAGAIEIQGKAMAVAERQARLASLRHERGLADNVDVIDAEMQLLQARTALIGARVDHALARLALSHAAGTLNPDEYIR